MKGELTMLVGQVKRMLSITAVRAQAACLLSRLGNLGGGVGAAYSRRQRGTGCGKEAGERGMFLLQEARVWVGCGLMGSG